MTARPPRAAPPTVEALLAALDHPHADAIAAVRAAILGADPTIAEGVKWNAPSFRTTEYFATVHLRERDGVRVILHLGAKVRDGAAVAVSDPDALLAWLAPDRASVRFRDLADVAARRPAFERVVRQWIAHV